VYSLLHSQVQDEYGLIVVPKHYIDNPKNDKEKLLKNAYEEYTAMLGWNDDMIAYRDSCIIRKARAIESSRRLLVWEKDTKTPPCSPKNESVVSVSSGQQEKLLQACKQVFKSCEDIRQRKGSDVADMNKNKGEAKTLNAFKDGYIALCAMYVVMGWAQPPKTIGRAKTLMEHLIQKYPRDRELRSQKIAAAENFLSKQELNLKDKMEVSKLLFQTNLQSFRNLCHNRLLPEGKRRLDPLPQELVECLDLIDFTEIVQTSTESDNSNVI
jgi:hypothetical protein